MNDASSTVKGLGVLTVFILTAKLLDYQKGLEFISAKARNYNLPTVITILVAGGALFLGGREIYGSMMIHKAKSAIVKQNYPEYISAMVSCADFVPNPAGAYYDLANAQLLQKDTEEALKNYQKSLQLSFKEEAAEVILQRIEDSGEAATWQKMLDYLLSNYPENTSFKMIKAKKLILDKQLEAAEPI